MANNLLIGLSRQIALSREMDVVANNIANLNTTGFKGETTLFQEYLMPGARANQFEGADRQLHYVLDRATWRDFSPGPLQQTGNPLDIAIDGNGFLAVQTANGNERYTRNGALQVNAAGEIVTNEGARLLGEAGPIVLQPGDRDITISTDGTVSVREGANAAVDAVRGKVRVVAFAEAQRLQKDGSSLFRAPAGTQPQPATNVRLMQGAIEKSNVNAVGEMTRMIQVSRTYQSIASMLERQGDLQRTAIERLAEVPA